MKAEYVCCCVDGWTPELTHYTEKQPQQRAGKTIKRAIVESGVFDRFTMFKDWHVSTYRMKMNGQLYAVVVHSAIEHFFKIT